MKKKGPICSFSAVKPSPVLASFFLVKKHSEMASLGIFLYRCRSFLFLTSESRKQEVSGCFLFIAYFMVLRYLSGFNNLFPMRKKNKRSYWCSVILLYRTIMPNYGFCPFELFLPWHFPIVFLYFVCGRCFNAVCENKLIERLWQSQTRPVPTTVLWLEDVFITIWEYTEKGQEQSQSRKPIA